jgi:hypothetical protein
MKNSKVTNLFWNPGESCKWLFSGARLGEKNLKWLPIANGGWSPAFYMHFLIWISTTSKALQVLLNVYNWRLYSVAIFSLKNLPQYLLLENVKGFEVSQARELLVKTMEICGYNYQVSELIFKADSSPTKTTKFLWNACSWKYLLNTNQLSAMLTQASDFLITGIQLLCDWVM